MRSVWLSAATLSVGLGLVPEVAQAYCTVYQLTACIGQSGVPRAQAGQCLCDIYEWVPRRAINAEDGDAIIVPIDGSGSDIVSLVTTGIGQLHRHALMSFDDGARVRHNTMYIFDEEDGVEGGSDYVELRTPLVGKIRFDADDLTNGRPGAVSQTIDTAYARSRLADTGLVLKPALQINGKITTEPNRPLFEAAVSSARATSSYYKLSDYSQMISMSLPYNVTRQGNLKGSHCSGYLAHFYKAQGLSLPPVSYPAGLRLDVGEVLYDEVRTACRDGIGAWSKIAATITGHFTPCNNIANQVVNCFAGLGCGVLNNDWRDGVGSGSATSPDNLLPASFRYSGTTAYDWDGTTLSSGPIPMTGRIVAHPGVSQAPSTSAASASPFQRAEALRYTGGYYVITNTVTL